MKITLHISFYYISDRIKYLNSIINEINNNYKLETDVFIHTNNINFSINNLNNYTNGQIKIIYHDLSKFHPFYLTWLCRALLYKQQNDYDIFMYIEDDILVPFKAVNYWLNYNEKLIENNYNLGFVRIEVSNNQEYITDLHGEYLDKCIEFDNTKYVINNKNPYCAFWIYNKNEFKRFIASKYFNIQNIPGDYGIREKSAIGLHGNRNYWYKNTLIPLVNNKLYEGCKIYHIPNNYVVDNSNLFATIKFDNAVINI
jgi:hypothetical protein